MQALSYLHTTSGLIWTLSCIPLGVLLTFIGFLIINKVPASWLCDYDEIPSEELISGERVNFVKTGIPVSVISVVCLILCRLQFNKGYDIYFIVFSLIIAVSLMITVCDIKYTIIPDQFTAAVGVLGLAIGIYDIARNYHILHSAWWSPLAGAAVGAGVMMLIDFIGMLVYKKDGMGFGDVKLFFAVGLLTGFPGTIYAFFISIVTATVCFCIIIVVSKIRNPKSEEVSTQSDESVDETETKETEPETEKISETETKAETEKTSETETETDTEDAKDETEPTDENENSSDISVRSYLAFAPYIAIATVCYIALFDVIHYLASLYIGLFK